MNVITIEHEAFQQIADRIASLEKGMNRTFEQHFEKTWLDSEKVVEMLGISRRTLQNYRDQGKIGFSQIGKKVYYRASDVLGFLERHYNEAFRARR